MMLATGVLLALLLESQTQRRASTALRELKLRLKEELMRIEHARLVRVRHYLTVPCLPKPGLAPWMYIWTFGSDENLLDVTSPCRRPFTRLLERFTQFYHIPRSRPKGGRPGQLTYHHQVLGLGVGILRVMHHKSLCSTFGVPHSTLSRVLAAAEDVLQMTLTNCVAYASSATLARQKALFRLTAARSPLLSFTCARTTKP
ncbi:LOW QUALITY PROTEIN: hypothetical protein PHMEG_00029973 [Phytophthora megakarya]|uniref:Nuclease HARBI1 n=1 Tax=Phytophthora megakarya TaxID=4795 RepID=A0A225V1E0_9STRA|nr:LOW QUALITY PROTEIN: hypothetical protein PHMEG_00029973 [Phytophthora megakarya]